VNTLENDYSEKRALYMAGKLGHEEFYCWLADKIGATAQDIPFTLDQIRASKDPHLNDLPLIRWDGMDPIIRAKAGRAGRRAWSISDTVCVLKALARREVH